MYIARRKNRVLRIEDVKAEEYAKMGYTVTKEDGAKVYDAQAVTGEEAMAKIKALEAENRTFNKAGEKLLAENQTLNTELTALKAEKEELTAELTALKAEYDELKAAGQTEAKGTKKAASKKTEQEGE